MWQKIKSFISKHKYDALLFLSLVATAPFFYDKLGWVSLVALLPMIFAIRHRFETKNTKNLVFIIWLFGLIYMLIVCSWVLNAHPQFLGVEQNASLSYFLYIAWVLMGLVLSLGFLLIGWVTARAIKVNFGFNKYILLFPFVWVAGEYLRSWGFSVIAYGREATLGPNWNFGVIGFSVTNTPFAYAARIGGLFGLSLAVVFVNVAIYLIIVKRYQAVAIIGLSILLAILLATTPGKDSSKLRVASLSMGYTSVQLNNTVDQTDYEAADLLVTPEYSSFFKENSTNGHGDFVARLFKGREGVVIYSRITPRAGSLPYNEVVLANQSASTIAKQPKRFLVPTGEYLPWVMQGFMSLVGRTNATAEFDRLVGRSAGTKAERAFEVGSYKIGAQACSGVLATDNYRALTMGGAEVLTNSASLYEFKDSPSFHNQAKQFASFIAIANNRPFVQAAQASYSYILDKDGRFIKFNGDGGGVQLGTVELGQSRTLYSLVGEWGAYASLIITGILLIVLLKHKY